MPTPSRRAAAALALLTGAGLLALSRVEPGSVAAAETRYLAMVVTTALLGLAAIDSRLAGPVGATVLAVAWWVPGTGRPAVALGVLVVAAASALVAAAGRGNGAEGRPFRDGFAVVGFALVLQVLSSSELLLTPGAGTLLLEVFGPLLPLALAAPALARRPGPGVALALLSLALVGPGIGWVGGLTLAGLALAARRDGLRWLGPIVPWTSPSALGVGGSAAVGLALLEGGPPRRRQIVVGLAVAGGLLALLASGNGLRPLLPLAPILASALVAPSSLAWGGLGLLLLGVSLDGTVTGSGPDLLVPGLLLVAWSVVREPRRMPATGLLAGVFGGAGLLAAAYPWQRPAPLETVLGLVPEVSGAWVLGLVVLAVACDRWVPRGLGFRAVALAVATAAVLAAPRVDRVLIDEEPVVLAPGSGIVDLQLPAGSGGLVVDTQLTHGQDLRPGQPVAALWIREPDGEILERLVLRNGRETGDWAAGRPDLRDSVSAPPPWSVRVAGSGTFFAHRYRSRFTIDSRDRDLQLQVRRLRRIPLETRVIVHRVEARSGGER